MQTILLKQRAAANGTLTIAVPEALRNRDLEVLVVLQPIEMQTTTQASLDEHGWPVGFFEETYGSLADDPIERLPQGEIEVREAIQ